MQLISSNLFEKKSHFNHQLKSQKLAALSQTKPQQPKSTVKNYTSKNVSFIQFKYQVERVNDRIQNELHSLEMKMKQLRTNAQSKMFNAPRNQWFDCEKVKIGRRIKNMLCSENIRVRDFQTYEENNGHLNDQNIPPCFVVQNELSNKNAGSSTKPNLRNIFLNSSIREIKNERYKPTSKGSQDICEKKQDNCFKETLKVSSNLLAEHFNSPLNKQQLSPKDSDSLKIELAKLIRSISTQIKLDDHLTQLIRWLALSDPKRLNKIQKLIQELAQSDPNFQCSFFETAQMEFDPLNCPEFPSKTLQYTDTQIVSYLQKQFVYAEDFYQKNIYHCFSAQVVDTLMEELSQIAQTSLISCGELASYLNMKTGKNMRNYQLSKLLKRMGLKNGGSINLLMLSSQLLRMQL